MSNNIYTADRSPDRRRARVEIVITTAVLLALVVAGALIYYDLSVNKTVVDDSNNQAVLSVVESQSDTDTYVEPDFKIKLPTGWKKVNNPEIIVDGKRFYPTRFQAVERIQVGRRVDIYIDDLPGTLPVNKALRAEALEDTIEPEFFTSYCADLVDLPSSQYATNTYIEWEGLEFMCKPSKSSNAIAAINTSAKEGLKFTKPDGSTIKFLIVWQDHSMRVNDSVFLDILRSFKLR